MIETMMLFLQKHKYVLFLVLFQMVVFHRWIFQGVLFTFGDVGVLTPENQIEFLKNALSIYTSNSGLGGLSVGASNNPLLFLFGLLASWGIDYIWSMKFVIFYPTVFGVVLSSYFLIRKLTRHEGAACIGALVYSYGTYFLITLTGALYLSLAYALAPFILLAGVRLLEYPTRGRQISLALILALVGYIEFRILYISVGILILYFLSFCSFSREGMLLALKRHIGGFLTAGLLFVLLNLFWVLPLVLAGKISTNQLFSRGLFGDSYFDIVNAFGLFHPWWTGELPAIFHKQEASPYAFLAVFLALFTLFLRTRKAILPFVFLLLLGVFLTKQSSEPWGALYQFLYDVFPGFNAFREASKFFFLSSLSASVLIGYLVAYRTQFSFLMRRGVHILLVILVSGVFLRAWFVGTDELGTMFLPREFPTEYTHLNEILNTKEYNRVLWFPHSNRFGAYSNEHPSLSLLLGMESDFREYIDPTEKNFVESLYSPFTDQSFGSFLRYASVRYVVVPSNLKWDDIKSPWKNSANYVSRLDVLPYLTKVQDDELKQGGITLYEVKDPLPHLFLTRTPLSLEGDPERERVAYEAVSPTEYRVTLRRVKEPVILNFSEKYHPDWHVRAGTFRFVDTFIVPGYDVPGSEARRNEFGLMSFVIDPTALKAGEEVSRTHEDGSVDVVLTLYFSAQKYYLLGLFLGFSTILLCFFHIVYTNLRGNNGLTKRKKL